MALDSVGVLHELPSVMARFRPDMVADSVQPRRPRPRKSEQSKHNVHTVHQGDSWIHQLLSIFHRDAAHDRVTTNYLLLLSNVIYIGSVTRTNFTCY